MEDGRRNPGVVDASVGTDGRPGGAGGPQGDADPAPSVDLRRFRLGYLPALDGVRALAVLAVMWVHARMTGGVALGPLGGGGGYGVLAFFVLSGFLITTVLVDERDRAGRFSLRRFYARRALRLLPALALLLAGCIFWALVLPPSRLTHETLLGVPASLFYYANWARVARGCDTLGMLGHTWSLSVEEQFYLLWPAALLLIAAVSRRRAVPLAVALAGVAGAQALRVMLWRGPQSACRLWSGLDTKADGLLLGCALALALNASSPGQRQQFSRWARWLVGPALALAVGVVLFTPDARSAARVPSASYVELPFALAVTVVLAHLVLQPSALLARALSSRPLVAIGRRSYGIYLWHVPVILVPLALGLSRPFALGAEFSVTFAVAWLSFALVERPCLRFKHRFESDDRGPRDATSAWAEAGAGGERTREDAGGGSGGGWSWTPLIVGVGALVTGWLAGNADVAGHFDAGRDRFLTPYHLAMLASMAALAGAGAVHGVLAVVRRVSPRPGILVAAAVGTTQMGILVADEFWHRLFGVDVTLWSPPHLLLVCLTGLAGVALLVDYTTSPRPAAAAMAAGLGALMSVGSFELLEYALGSPSFRIIWSAPVIAALALGGAVAAREASGLRWGASMAGATASLLTLLPMAFNSAVHRSAPTPQVAFLAAGVAVDLVYCRVGYRLGRVGLAALGGWAAAFAVNLPWLRAVGRTWWPDPLLVPLMLLGAPAAVAAAYLGGAVGRGLRRARTAGSVTLGLGPDRWVRRAAALVAVVFVAAGAVVLALVVSKGLVKGGKEVALAAGPTMPAALEVRGTRARLNVPRADPSGWVTVYRRTPGRGGKRWAGGLVWAGGRSFTGRIGGGASDDLYRVSYLPGYGDASWTADSSGLGERVALKRIGTYPLRVGRQKKLAAVAFYAFLLPGVFATWLLLRRPKALATAAAMDSGPASRPAELAPSPDRASPPERVPYGRPGSRGGARGRT